MNRPTVAIVGAATLVGASVARHLATRDHRVVAVDGADAPRWHIRDVKCRTARAEPDDQTALQEALRGVDAVIYCRDRLCSAPPSVSEARRRAVRRTRVVFDACAAEQIARVVYVSNGSCLYDESDPGAPTDEHSRYTPGLVDNATLEGKWSAEAEVYRYIADGLDAVIVIPTLVFGPGDAGLTTGRWIRRIAAGRLAVGLDEAVCNAVDARDVAEGIAAALRGGRRGRRYILGGENVAVDRIIEIVAELADKQLPRRTISADIVARLDTVLGAVVQGVRQDGVPAGGPLLEAAIRLGAVDTDRAGGELQLTTRPLETTLSDTIRWMQRVGYLQW